MTFEYRTRKLSVGDTLVVPDGDMLAGTTMELDGKGGFRVVAHILARNDGVPLGPQTGKELAQ